jgi:alcohol dehydrogenase class IV
MPRLLDFRMSGRLLFGAGALAQLPTAVKSLGATRALIVTDPGLVKAGLHQRVVQVLDAAGVAHATYDQVEPDPRIAIATACLAALRASGADVLIGLGGGSALDIAKVAAVLATNGGEVKPLIGVDQVPKAGLPVIAIPTTAGTGSEVTPIAVLSDSDAHLKKGIVSPHLYPAVALVDPELALGLPARVTAFTGMDALTHAIEAYTNRFAQPFVDTFALEAVRLAATHLRRAVHVGSDIEARTGMALCSLYGGMCLGPVNTAAVHALAYPLGGTFNVPHGVANSLLLPHVMAANLPADLAKYARIAEALGERIAGLSPSEAAARSVVAVQQLAADVGIVTRMRDLGIPESALDGMADAAMQVTRLLGNNPRVLGRDDVRRIYQNAF